MMKKLNLIIPLLILLLAILGCSLDKTEKMVRGRLKYIVTESPTGGGHGWGGWRVSNREFYVNGKKWSPEAFDLSKMEVRCYANPDEAFEAFKCDGFSDDKEFTAVLRMKGDAAEWVLASEKPAYSGNTFGEWFGKGRWLVFKDYFYNVETSEKRAIKELPGEPAFYFGSVSPDLKTIVYQGIICNAADKSGKDNNYVKTCERREEYEKNKIEILWLIDAETGDAKFLELSYEKYPWVHLPSYQSDDRLELFQKSLVWEKDEKGQDRLVYPN